MADLKTYNPKKITMAFGNHMVRGYAEDSFISIEPVGEGVTSQSGADGEVVRSVDPDSRFTVKITLQQTSSTNDFLKKMRNKDKAHGTGIFPLIVKDLMGGEVFSAKNAWVKNDAAWERGKTASDREWEIECVGEFE